VPTLPEVLKKQGYSTHMVGKWHLGYYNDSVVPWKRGFDRFYGYLTAGEDYFKHSKCVHIPHE
jgi:arylsulfatase A-like enzyme